VRHIPVALLLIAVMAGCTEPASRDKGVSDLPSSSEDTSTVSTPQIQVRSISLPTEMFFASSGERLYVREGRQTVQTWDTDSRELLSTASIPELADVDWRWGDASTSVRSPALELLTERWVMDPVLRSRPRQMVAMSRDGDLALVHRSVEDEYVVRRTQDNKEWPLRGVAQHPRICAADFQGEERLLLGFPDGAVLLCEIASNEVQELRPGVERWAPPEMWSGSVPSDVRVTDVELLGDRAVAVGPGIGLYVWDLAHPAKAPQHLKPATAQASRIAVAPDASEIALCDEIAGVTRWDLRHLQKTGEWLYPAHAVAWTADGDLLATGMADEGAWISRLADEDTPSPIAPSFLPGRFVPGAVAFPDNRVEVYSSYDGQFSMPSQSFMTMPSYRWSLGPSKRVRWNSAAAPTTTDLYTSGKWRRQYYPDADLWLFSRQEHRDGALKWGLRAQPGDGTPLVSLQAHPSSFGFFLDVSASGLIAIAEDQAVALLDAASGERVRTFDAGETERPISALALSRDGSTLAVKTWRVRVYRTDSGEHISTFPRDGGISGDIRLSPDGSVLVAWDDYKMVLTDTATGRETATVKLDRPRHWPNLAFSPDGSLLACGLTDGSVSLCDGRTGTLQHVIQVGPGEITGLAFNADSLRLVATGSSGRTTVIDPQSGQVLIGMAQVGTIRPKAPGWIAWTPDGRYDGTDEAIEACIRFKVGGELLPASRFPELRVEGLINEVLKQ